jgi:hypothetical protein
MAGTRKRQKVAIGTSSVNASDLAGLTRAWKQKRLVLFLGAGVSISYRLPTWKQLVLDLLFEQAASTRRLGAIWPHYRHALAAWITDYFDYNPLVLARMVERDLHRRQKRDFLEVLRKHLYKDERIPKRARRTTLKAVADLIERSDATQGVAAVVTFNFDDLLERELRKSGVDVYSVIDGSRRHDHGIRVVHAHGFVPKRGRIDRKNMIFTENDYHRLTESVFHWALSEIVGFLRNETVLFVGLSMSDPSLRRLLDASRNSKIPSHWQIQLRHTVRDHEEREAMADIERRARDFAKRLEMPQKKTPVMLKALLHDALRQADSYDRQVFESMGVKTIWVEDLHDIPLVLQRIHG